MMDIKKVLMAGLVLVSASACQVDGVTVTVGNDCRPDLVWDPYYGSYCSDIYLDGYRSYSYLRGSQYCYDRVWSNPYCDGRFYIGGYGYYYGTPRPLYGSAYGSRYLGTYTNDYIFRYYPNYGGTYYPAPAPTSSSYRSPYTGPSTYPSTGPSTYPSSRPSTYSPPTYPSTYTPPTYPSTYTPPTYPSSGPYYEPTPTTRPSSGSSYSGGGYNSYPNSNPSTAPSTHPSTSPSRR